MRKFLSIALFIGILTQIAQAQSYSYQSIEGDPTGTRIYTLANGLKVYLSVNEEVPRIQTYIAVNTGSTNDPADVTGLAHYLEHMVFKGTSRMGTQDWANESKYLKQISDLYEAHKAESDPARKKAIYHQIDSLSGVAAKLAVANEYDKMISGLGAKGTNAFTSLERTVYVNDIPSTELEKWMMVESERFGELVLRLFHTELEAVYEEFNRAQDNDGRKVFYAMSQMLYPTHPYGTQTTIGTGEHLKNPSMEKIHAYFKKYYVPNNMAICLAGSFDYDATIKMIDQYFGKMKSVPVEAPKMPVEAPLTKITSHDVYGPTEELVSMGYRIGGYRAGDYLIADLVSSVLSNGQAGLMDMNLLQKQLVLSASAYAYGNRDYGQFMMTGGPKKGQTLEEVRDLMLAEVEKIKKGEFSDDLMKAVIRNMKKDALYQLESNSFRVSQMSDAFIMGADWADYVNYNNRLAAITREQVIEWTKKNLKDNYCIVFKRTGEDKNVYKVDKPSITPVELNRTAKSEFYKEFEKKTSSRLTPQFLDYKKDLVQRELKDGVTMYYVPNKNNDLFQVYLELDENLREDPTVGVALMYLDYLGTSKISAEDLKKKAYSLGIGYSVSTSYITLDGLVESFEEGFSLLQDLLLNCKADEEALRNLISDIKKSRDDDKLNKDLILNSAMRDYVTYGAKNKFNNRLSNAQLDALKGEDLVKIIHSLTSYRHQVFFYGKTPFDAAYASVKKLHTLPAKMDSYPVRNTYTQQEVKENTVLFVDYDMVQTQMLMLSKAGAFDANMMPEISLFNSYFGSGLSSIVFQEIRESKALAYSAYAGYTVPRKKDEAHYVQAYIGTQVNKLPQAVDAMIQLMNNMPNAEIQFNESRVAAMKKIESERILKASLYMNYRNAERLGLTEDIRKKVYERMSSITFKDLESFFNKSIKGRAYTFCVIGRKADMDMAALSKLGTVKELALEELFGY